MDIQRIVILVFVWLLIFYQFFSFMILFAPLLIRVNTIGFAIFIIIFVCLVILLCISYFRSIFTEPGSPPSDINERYDNLENIKNRAKQQQAIKKEIRKSKTQHATNIQFDEIQSLNKIGFCFKCQKVKQIRVHHCKICKKCILRMDHHCPWVGNCVGKYNHKYFIQFLFYATVSLTIVFLSIAVDFFIGQPVARKLQQIPRILLYCCCVTSGLLALSIGFLFVTQMMTVSKNLTTLENFVEGIAQRNPWNKQTFAQNMQQIFGKSSWFIPSKPIFGSEYAFYDSIQV